MVSPPALQRLTVQDAVTAYLQSVERAVLGGTLSPATQENYARDLREFVDLAGAGTVLDDITGDQVDDIVLAYAARPDGRYRSSVKPGAPGAPGRGPGAQARFRQSVSRMFTHAERRGWVQRSPMPETVVRPKARGQLSVVRMALPEESARALISVPEEKVETESRVDQRLSLRDTAVLRVLVEVGPRVSEMCAMDQSDLLHVGGTWWLRVRFGKGGKTRDLPLSEPTAAALRAYIDAPRPQPPAGDPAHRREDAARALFVSFRGRRLQPRDVQYLVDRAVKRLPAQVRRRVTPHGLRHTAATLLLASGAADVKTVQSLLGHSSLATTGMYLDQVSEELVRAVAAHPVTGTRRS